MDNLKNLLDPASDIFKKIYLIIIKKAIIQAMCTDYII